MAAVAAAAAAAQRQSRQAGRQESCSAPRSRYRFPGSFGNYRLEWEEMERCRYTAPWLSLTVWTSSPEWGREELSGHDLKHHTSSLVPCLHVPPDWALVPGRRSTRIKRELFLSSLYPQLENTERKYIFLCSLTRVFGSPDSTTWEPHQPQLLK